MRPEVIAEIGWNHQGDMELAKEMIKQAAVNGADYAKFQTWSVDKLKPGPWDNDGRREIYQKAELTRERHVELINYCKEVGIKFLSSASSIEAATLLLTVGCKEVKIPSLETNNLELLKFVNANFDRIFLSVGAHTLEEAKKAISLFDKDKLVVLHCVSVYPCNYDMANIPKFKVLQSIHDKIGYSDHIQGVDSAKVAIGEGAVVIEKHFTTDNNLPGRDNVFAILPEDIKELSTFIDRREDMFIDHGVDYLPQEKDSRDNYRGRWDG